MSDVPDRDEITAWLRSEHRRAQGEADVWAGFLTGLPWRYIRPVVTIAINTRNHPAVAMAGAAQFSRDAEFVAAAREHIAARDPGKPTATAATPPKGIRRLERRQELIEQRIAAASDEAERERLKRQHGQLAVRIGQLAQRRS